MLSAGLVSAIAAEEFALDYMVSPKGMIPYTVLNHVQLILLIFIHQDIN